MLELEDLGIAEKFLGMRISRTNEEGYCLDQEQTIEDVLENHGMADANPVRVPISEVQVIEGDDDLLKEKMWDCIQYRQSRISSL
uniref:Reverse transcriptase Ty1/copia-type domain-containing protein n=1 Tax=Hyaloperonospora arabidopsidis (strain Emoy2) TaxID=559515 RepID=M4BE93_HYAAE